MAAAVACVAVLMALVVMGNGTGASAAEGPGTAAEGPAEAAVGETGRGRPALARVESGWLWGRATAGHVTFEGVPYAAPPVGERRWAPPRPRAPWAGIRDATRPADRCAQRSYDENGNVTVVGAEDCLYLNVTAPRRARPGSALPVIVWLHGGAFTDGAGHDYGGARLAEGGDVVVVTVNYRLAALGFLSSPALDGEGNPSGNYGLQDQAEALRWVRRNAARFGGDPANVTLAGQSAGSRAVCAHLAAPASRGLFDRAILQSGSCANLLPTRAEADGRGAQAIAEMGCAGDSDVAACLRSRPVTDVVRALADQSPGITDEVADAPWNPVAGTAVLPDQPIDALARGSAAGVPLLMGGTRDEMRAFVGFRYDAAGNPMTEPMYQGLVEEAFGAGAGDVLARYPAGDHPSPALALATLLTDWGGRIGACPVLRTAQVASGHAPVYAYEFAEDRDESYSGYPLGAHHNWDLPFLWDVSIPGAQYPELTAEQVELSDRMIAYWTDFARSGDPNGPGSVPWPEFGAGDEAVLGLAAGDGGIAPVDVATSHGCDFWLSR